MSNSTTDSPGWVNLKYLLASTKSRLQVDDRWDEHITQYLIDAITELNCFHLDISGTRTTVLDISDISTVDLPGDYIDYVKIGIVINGKIWTLTNNQNIAVPISGDCGEDTNPYSEYFTQMPYSPQYGLSGGYNIAEYKVDKQSRRIIVSGYPPGGQLYLEYISSGISMDQETVIPRKYVPVVRAYAIWQWYENDPKTPMNDKQRKGNLYAQEVRRASMSEMPTLDEIVDAIKAGRRQTPKG